jgi:hypothetical protein
MKLESFLFRAALLGILAALVGFALNALALVFFAGAASLWVLLIATGDYARRPDYAATLVNASRRGAALPLAA